MDLVSDRDATIWQDTTVPRVMHVIPSLGAGGGAEQVLLQLLPALRAIGLEVEVACLWAPEDLSAELETRGIVVRRLGFRYGERWSSAKVLGRLTMVVDQFRPDLLHSHLYFAVLYGALVPTRNHAVRITTLHNVDYEIYPVRTRTEAMRRELHRRALQRSAAHICVSAAVEAHYRQEFALRDTFVIPNAIADELFGLDASGAAATREQLQIPAGAPLVVLPGRLVKQKGHRDALFALRRVEHVHLALAGRGPLRDELEKLSAELGLTQRVHFLDVLPHPQFVQLLAAADVIIMPSHQEGFGIVAAESMAAGRPLIATDIDPLRDLVQDSRTGLLVPPASPEALTAAIQRLLGTPEEAKALGAAARAAVRQRFSSARVAERTAEIYAQCLAARDTSRVRWLPRLRRVRG